MNTPDSISQVLIQSISTVALAESCTGGYVSKLLTDSPGASAYYLGGIIAYSNEVKRNLLNVTSVDRYGAVSAETAAQMADNIKKLFDADYGLSITGIAGPTGGSEEKPVGTFFVGISSTKSLSTFKYFYPSSRDEIRLFAANEALDILRRNILNIPYTSNAIHKEHRNNC